MSLELMKTNEKEMFVAKIYNWNLRFFVFYVKKFLLLPWTRVTFFQDMYSDKKISNWTKATFRSWFLRLFRVFTKKKKEPVSVTTPVISKMIDLAPKPSNSKKIDLPHGKKVFRTSQGRPTRRHAQEFHPRFSNIGHIV